MPIDEHDWHYRRTHGGRSMDEDTLYCQNCGAPSDQCDCGEGGEDDE